MASSWHDVIGQYRQHALPWGCLPDVPLKMAFFCSKTRTRSMMVRTNVQSSVNSTLKTSKGKLCFTMRWLHIKFDSWNSPRLTFYFKQSTNAHDIATINHHPFWTSVFSNTRTQIFPPSTSPISLKAITVLSHAPYSTTLLWGPSSNLIHINHKSILPKSKGARKCANFQQLCTQTSEDSGGPTPKCNASHFQMSPVELTRNSSRSWFNMTWTGGMESMACSI